MKITISDLEHIADDVQLPFSIEAADCIALAQLALAACEDTGIHGSDSATDFIGVLRTSESNRLAHCVALVGMLYGTLQERASECFRIEKRGEAGVATRAIMEISNTAFRLSGRKFRDLSLDESIEALLSAFATWPGCPRVKSAPPDALTPGGAVVEP